MTIEEEVTESWVLNKPATKEEPTAKPNIIAEAKIETEVKLAATANKNVQNKPVSKKPAARKSPISKANTSTASKNKLKEEASTTRSRTDKNAGLEHIADQVKVFSSRRVWPD